MTPEEKQQKAEALRVRAMWQWQAAIRAAVDGYEGSVRELLALPEFEGLTIADVPWGEAESIMLGVVEGIANMVTVACLPEHDAEDRSRRFAPSAVDLATLRRVKRARRPPLAGNRNAEAIEVAVRIVDEYARLFHSPNPVWWPDGIDESLRLKLAPENALVTALAMDVDRSFGALENRLTEVKELLQRYGNPGRPKGAKNTLNMHVKRAASDSPPELPKLRAAGILAELNRLAGEPLGRLDSGNEVHKAKARQKKAQASKTTRESGHRKSRM